MTTMTMLDLRKNSDIILEKLKKKEKISLSYRGKPVATIEPIQERVDWREDTFAQFIEEMKSSPREKIKSKITNKEIDSLVYGI